MMYQNYPYGIFNTSYLSQYQAQLQEAQRQREQDKNIIDMVKAITDYFEASRKVHPDYQQKAMDACLLEIARQIYIDEQRKNGYYL